MKTILSLLTGLVVLCVAAQAQETANLVQMQVPSGPQLDGKLEVIDSSQGHWIGLTTQITQSDENGFEASCSAAGEKKLDIRGKFERSANSLGCSMNWEATSELPEAFMMLVFRIPVESLQDGIILSGDRDISMAKILGGTPTRTSMDNLDAFSLGPIDGKTISFTADSAEHPLAVEVIKTDTDFHVRFLITPRKSPLATTGSVGWTMAIQ